MTAHDTADERVQGSGTETENDGRSRIGSALSTGLRSDAGGSLEIVAGGALLARALRGARRRPLRAALQGAVGAGLLGYGLRERRAADPEGHDDDQESAEAQAHLEQSKVLHQSEQNPRGTSDEADVEQQTDAGNIEFTEDQDSGPHNEPHLDSEGDIDPRTEAGEDLQGDDVDVDLSEASMADEASEATGPNTEQSQPATTQGTEPEPTPDADVQAPNAEETDGNGESDVPGDEDGEMDVPKGEEGGEVDVPETDDEGEVGMPEEEGQSDVDVPDEDDEGDVDAPDDERTDGGSETVDEPPGVSGGDADPSDDIGYLDDDVEDDAPERDPLDEADAVESAAEPIDGDTERVPEDEATEGELAEGERDVDESDPTED